MAIAKEVWDALQKKYDIEEERSKKYAVSRYLRYQMTDDKFVEVQSHEIQKTANEIISEGMPLDDRFQVVVIIDKLPPLWKDFKNTLRHKTKEFSLESLIIRLRIEEEARKHDQKEDVNAIPRKKPIAVLKSDLELKGNKMKYGSNKQNNLQSRNDMLIFGSNLHVINDVKSMLSANFDMKDLEEPDVILGYNDADWNSLSNDSKATSSYIFNIGGGVIARKSKKQTILAQPMKESEMIALVTASEEASWLRSLLSEIPTWERLILAILIHCDSTVAVAKV
ncbi:hypothetical protein E6C27_scaffold270G00050 [Cucumis melo var. makuwa]|uniref:Uncharacterized protein n=1 Tax=Cucumis melo var. makuwa TaxID=1194695 RepID=A0A5A7T7J0_CUCMM|nr:hypothetical protein E6C27_scaffold270G00050 [Cucumis melo var. makuwa]